MKRTCISLLAVALTLAGACKKDSDKKKDSEAPGASRASVPTDDQPTPVTDLAPSRTDNATIDYSFLAPVPADSPFLVAMLRPMPSDFLSYLQKGIAPLTGFAQIGLSAAREKETDPLGRAILDEIDGKLSIEGMHSLGITVTPKMAMYAIGLSFAVRMELADGKTFAAVLNRIEKKSGKTLPRASLGAVSYRYFEEDEGSIAIAIIGNQLVVGIMHVDAKKHVLPVLLGAQKPEKSMADAGTVQGIVNKYKLMGMAVGYIDTVAVARLFTGQTSGASKAIVEASIKDMPSLSPVCQSEIAQLAAAAPRMVFGYQGATAKSYESIVSLELRSDLAKDMAGLHSQGVDASKLLADKPVVAVSLALSLDKGKEWLHRKVKEIANQPFKCEHFAEFNANMAEGATELQAPLPPFLQGAHGFLAVAKELRMNGEMPTGKGYMALGVNDPMALLTEMQKDRPALASAKFAKGKPTNISLGMLGLPDATVLPGDRWLSVALGDGMTETASATLASKNPSNGPFFVMGYDYVELMRLSAKINPGGNMIAANMVDFFGKFLGYSTTSLYFTDDGILGRMKTVIE